MPFATVAEVKNRLSEYLARAKKTGRPIVVTRHGRPYALIQPISAVDVDDLVWEELVRNRLAHAWDDDDDALYDYL